MMQQLCKLIALVVIRILYMVIRIFSHSYMGKKMSQNYTRAHLKIWVHAKMLTMTFLCIKNITDFSLHQPWLFIWVFCLVLSIFFSLLIVSMYCFYNLEKSCTEYFLREKRTCFPNWGKITIKKTPQPCAKQCTNPQDVSIFLEYQFYLKIWGSRYMGGTLFSH